MQSILSMHCTSARAGRAVHGGGARRRAPLRRGDGLHPRACERRRRRRRMPGGDGARARARRADTALRCKPLPVVAAQAPHAPPRADTSRLRHWRCADSSGYLLADCAGSRRQSKSSSSPSAAATKTATQVPWLHRVAGPRALHHPRAAHPSHFELLAMGLACHARALDGRSVTHANTPREGVSDRCRNLRAACP